jgi:branched-chain amino acid transport system ATP-binding protein
VCENIAVGSHLSRPSRADALAAARDVAQAVGLGPMLDLPASSLTVAGRKRLELARALAIEPKLPAARRVLAGLNPSEVRDMVPVIHAICRARHHIVMIEHVMQAVMSLAEHVFVLAEGSIIADGVPRHSDRPATRAWSRPISATARRGACSGRPMADRCSPFQALHAGYGATEILRGIDLAVNDGEIVAVLGSNGAGQVHAQPRDFGCTAAVAAARIRLSRMPSNAQKPVRDRLARADPRAGGKRRSSRT